MLPYNMTMDAVDPLFPATHSNMKASLRKLKKALDDHFTVWPVESARAFEEIALPNGGGLITRVFHICYAYSHSGKPRRTTVQKLCAALHDDIIAKYPSGGVLVWRRHPTLNAHDRAEYARKEAAEDQLPLPPEDWAHSVSLRIGVVGGLAKRANSEVPEGGVITTFEH